MFKTSVTLLKLIVIIMATVGMRSQCYVPQPAVWGPSGCEVINRLKSGYSFEISVIDSKHVVDCN